MSWGSKFSEFKDLQRAETSVDYLSLNAIKTSQYKSESFKAEKKLLYTRKLIE